MIFNASDVMCTNIPNIYNLGENNLQFRSGCVESSQACGLVILGQSRHRLFVCTAWSVEIGILHK